MTVFSRGIQHKSYIWQLTALCFVLGLILAADIRTAFQVSRAGNGPHREGFFFGNTGSTGTLFNDLNKQIHVLQQENSHLRRQNQDINDQLAHRTGAASALNQELKDAQAFSGLTEVAGPGVQITLTDDTHQTVSTSNPTSLNNLIHDTDIAEVVNELKIAGAEAVAVNGQRIVSNSTIRCVGPVIQINGVPAAPPYAVQAIGSPSELYSGLNLPGGILDQIRHWDPSMAKMVIEKKLLLPAYAGSTEFHYAHIVPPQHDPLATGEH